MARHNVPTILIPDDYDAAEAETEPFDRSLVLLSRAVERGVISSEESQFIEASRGTKMSLQAFADERGESYLALRQRRSRAETRLRRHFYANGDVK